MLRRKRLYYILLTATFVLIAGIVYASQVSVIELKDGTVYRDVDVKVDRQFKTLEIKDAGSKVSVSFTKVKIIKDVAGNDITSAFLGSYYTPGQDAANARVDTTESQDHNDTGETVVANPTSLPGMELRENYFEVGSGFALSPDYHSALEDEFGDVSGGYGLVSLECGFGIHAAKRLFIIPQFRMLYGMVNINYGFSSSMKANIVFCPGLATSYHIGNRGSTMFLITGELGLVVPVTDFDQFDWGSGGMEMGITAGILFSEEWVIELGYLYVPVEIKSSGYDVYGGGYNSFSKTANFGGPFLVWRKLFWF